MLPCPTVSAAARARELERVAPLATASISVIEPARPQRVQQNAARPRRRRRSKARSRSARVENVRKLACVRRNPDAAAPRRILDAAADAAVRVVPGEAEQRDACAARASHRLKRRVGAIEKRGKRGGRP